MIKKIQIQTRNNCLCYYLPITESFKDVCGAFFSNFLSISVDGNYGGECNVLEKHQLSPGSLPNFCIIHQMM